MKKICYCKNCQKFGFKDAENNTIISCGQCSNPLIITEYTEEYYESLNTLKKEELKIKIKNENDDEIKEQERIRQELLEKAKKEIEEKKELWEQKLKKAFVTTGDLKEDYEVIGPVFFQINDAGGGKVFQQYRSKYQKEINSLYSMGLDSGDRTSTVESASLFLNALNIVMYGQSDQTLLGLSGNAHRNFDVAFLIAVEELKLRAVMMGGDAVICMRHDFDLDTNGWQHFYLQMYGTAIKFKNRQSE